MDLRTLQMTALHQRREVSTVDGILLFGKNRLQEFPEAFLRAGCFAGTAPVFVSRFAVTRRRAHAWTRVDQGILDYVRRAGGASTAQVAAQVGRTPRATRDRLNQLVQSGLLVPVGSSSRDPRKVFRLARG
jgi:predicted HTH transcriptional regulator